MRSKEQSLGFAIRNPKNLPPLFNQNRSEGDTRKAISRVGNLIKIRNSTGSRRCVSRKAFRIFDTYDGRGRGCEVWVVEGVDFFGSSSGRLGKDRYVVVFIAGDDFGSGTVRFGRLGAGSPVQAREVSEKPVVWRRLAWLRLNLLSLWSILLLDLLRLDSGVGVEIRLVCGDLSR